MLKITNSVAIPLKDFIGKGSCQERIKHAQKLNELFYNKLEAKMVEGTIPVEEYKKTLQEVLPENIKFYLKTYIKRLLCIDNAYVSMIINNYDEAEKFEIQIPSRKNLFEKRVINKKDSHLFMHEMFHLFVEMANPKFIARCNFNDTEYNFYQNWIYTRNSSKFKLKDRQKWEKALKEYLSYKNLEKQIDFLQNCRYRLLEEKLVYYEGKKFGGNNCMSQDFHFDKKIKIIKKLLYKAIQKARKKNKKA